jgi:murein DD-endopeptidase MepM/ murein hydrolase activator NlpD
MIRLSINLPTKRRLDLSLVKDRKREDEDPIIPSLGKIRRTKSGNKASRYFRHIFEHKKVKKLLGMNLILSMFLMSFVPAGNVYFDGEQDDVIAQAPLVLSTEKGLRYPLDHVNITQGYRFYHPGIDFDGITGEPVYPIMAGTVAAIDYSNTAYGNAILLDHGNNVTSLYAHLSKIYVSPSQEVQNNEVIGTVGATGWSSGDHLHLEIRENGYQINPLTILP